jgi:hypothetical protein
VQVAQFWHEHDLALRALAKLGDIPRASFLKGIVHLGRSEWAEAAACFAAAHDVPETERAMADTVIALAPIRTGDAIPHPSAFEPALKAAARDARSLIIVARVADGLGINDVAAKAFGDAVALLRSDSTLAERSMAAAYAAEKRDATAVIEILDGHVPEDRATEELMRLAQAHALENPPRRRNVDFFDRLPPAVRELSSLRVHARAYFSTSADILTLKGSSVRSSRPSHVTCVHFSGSSRRCGV